MLTPFWPSPRTGPNSKTRSKSARNPVSTAFLNRACQTTEGGIFDATVYQSPKTGPKQTQTSSKTAHNSSKRVSKKYPLEGRAFGKTFTWGISSDFMQKMVRKWRFFIFLKFCQKMLRIGLTCIVWYADLENPVETQFRANFGIVFAISNFQTVASKIPPSLFCG